MTACVYNYTLEFAKTGAVCFVGHLDLMQAFRKAFRRAGLPVKYSEGYNPHMEFGVASPLPLGFDALAELADIKLTQDLPENVVFSMLDAELPPGISLKNVSKKEVGTKSNAAYVEKAEYELIFGSSEYTCVCEKIDELMRKNEVIVVKKTKKGEKEEDIRQDIYDLQAFKIDEQTVSLRMTISAGSERNLKPETLITALFGDVPRNVRVTRRKLLLKAEL